MLKRIKQIIWMLTVTGLAQDMVLLFLHSCWISLQHGDYNVTRIGILLSVCTWTGFVQFTLALFSTSLMHLMFTTVDVLYFQIKLCLWVLVLWGKSDLQSTWGLDGMTWYTLCHSSFIGSQNFVMAVVIWLC